MSAALTDRRHVHEVELCVECLSIRHEITRLEGEIRKARSRECSLRDLIAKREGVLDADLRELAGSLDGLVPA